MIPLYMLGRKRFCIEKLVKVKPIDPMIPVWLHPIERLSWSLLLGVRSYSMSTVPFWGLGTGLGMDFSASKCPSWLSIRKEFIRSSLLKSIPGLV